MTQTNPETIATGAARLRAEISGHLACVTISYPEAISCTGTQDA